MTTDSATETDGVPDAYSALMAFAAAMDAAGLGSGLRAMAPVQRNDEPRAYVRLSIYPHTLRQLSALLTAHTEAKTEPETCELLRALAGEAAR